MIHVCFGLYDKNGRYSKFTGTAMLSIFENTNHPVTVHILHDNTLSADNRDKFSYIAGMYGQTVKFYNVEQTCADKINEIKSSMHDIVTTIGTFYRFMVTEVLSSDIEKLIYLDSDIIVNLDIKELWNVDLNNAPLAAVPETVNESVNVHFYFQLCHDGLVGEEDYFNAGVLVINLKHFRECQEKIWQGIKFVAEHPQYKFWDQDVLNYCFAAQAIKLPRRFNRLMGSVRRGGSLNVENCICHYVGSTLRLDISEAPNRIFMKYFAKTPWFSEETIGHLYEGFRRIYIEQKNFAAQISAIMSGKTRAFFVSPNQIEAVKQIFYVKPEEEIIAADSPESLQRMVDSLAASRGEKVFFVLLFLEYQPVREILTRKGFVEGRDFLNAVSFLSDAHGVPLNSYPLIKLL